VLRIELRLRIDLLGCPELWLQRCPELRLRSGLRFVLRTVLWPQVPFVRLAAQVLP
jgi:hypothetical protein